MWRKATMFLFATAMAASGQAISGPEQSQTPGEFHSEMSQMPQVRVVQHHDKLRRDRDEKIVVFSVFPPSNSQPVPRSLRLVVIPSRCS